MKLTLLLLVVSFALVIDAKCVGGSPYLWSQMRCFCDMQNYANKNGSPPDAKVSWMGYSAGFSKGSCTLCSSYFKGQDLQDEDSLSSDDMVAAVLQNPKIIFPLNQCIGQSSHFISYESCIQWARTKPHLFLNGDWTVRYVAKHGASPAYCNVCGPTDPCNGEIRG
ncbi:hypothetical protein RCL1_000657 [Eukaryota sp. TZLM3-RCL]